MKESVVRGRGLSRREFLEISAMFTAGAALAGCTPPATPPPVTEAPQPIPLTPTSGQSAAAKVLRVAVSENRESFDPAFYYAHTDAIIPVNSQEGLIRYKMGTYEFEPALAESWEVKDGGKTIAFKIREGVKYSDGTSLDAESIKYDIDRQMKIAQGPSWLLNDFVDKVTVDSAFQITFNLKDVLPGYLHNLANVWSPRFQSPTAYKANEKKRRHGSRMGCHTYGWYRSLPAGDF